MTWATDSYSIGGGKRVQVKYRTRTTTLSGEVLSTYRDKAEKTVTTNVEQSGPYTEATAKSNLTSSNSVVANGSGSIVTSTLVRANAAGMYYVQTTTETHGAWGPWIENV